MHSRFCQGPPREPRCGGSSGVEAFTRLCFWRMGTSFFSQLAPNSVIRRAGIQNDNRAIAVIGISLRSKQVQAEAVLGVEPLALEVEGWTCCQFFDLYLAVLVRVLGVEGLALGECD